MQIAVHIHNETYLLAIAELLCGREQNKWMNDLVHTRAPFPTNQINQIKALVHALATAGVPKTFCQNLLFNLTIFLFISFYCDVIIVLSSGL